MSSPWPPEHPAGTPTIPAAPPDDRRWPTNGPVPGGPVPTAPDLPPGAANDEGDRERFHPAYIITTMVRSIRGFIIPIAIAIFSGSRGDLVWLAIGGAFAAFTVINAVANWWLSSYEITGRSLRLRTGWLNRQERSVPFERIQSIDLQEPPLARLFGVAQLRVETAGGGANADIVIEAIALDDAAALRNQLLAERAQRVNRAAPDGPAAFAQPGGATGQDGAVGQTHTGIDTGIDTGTVIAALSGRDLLIAGLTSGRIGPAAAILAAVSQFGGDLIGSRVESVAESSAFTPTQAILGLIVIGGLVAWALSILGTVITFSGFTLRREADQLVISSGLIERRRTTIPLHRIQSITVKEGLLRQPFGLTSLHFVSAGYGGGQQNNDSGVLFPLVRRRDVADLLVRAVPAFAADIEAVRRDGQRLPARALRRYITLPIVWDVLFLAVAIAATTLIPFTPWWYGLVVLLFPSWLFALLGYHDTRWLWDSEDRLLVQGRGVARTVTIIPRRRVQFREVRQTWFQRRAALATLGVRVAGSTFGNSATIAHMDAADATELATRLGFHDIPRTRTRQGRRARPAPAPAWSEN